MIFYRSYRFTYTLIGILVLFCFPYNLLSQNENKKKSEFDIYSYKPEPKDRIILEVNHNGWLNPPSGVKGKLTSGGVNFYLYFDFPIRNTKFSFAVGGGISSYNMHGKFNIRYKIDSLKNEIVFSDLVRRDEPYKKNRFGLKILEVPVEFRFRTHSSYQLKVMLGFKTGIVVQSFRKVFDADGKRKAYDVYGVNTLRYGPHFRIGVEQIHITGFVALSSLFSKGKGSADIMPYSLGLAWTPRVSLGSGKVTQQF